MRRHAASGKASRTSTTERQIKELSDVFRGVFFRIVWSLVVVVWISVTTKRCQGRPAILPSSRNVTSASSPTAMDFLIKYGYLPSSDLETGNLRTEDQLRAAIRMMQKFGNIPQTGTLDDETLKLMKKKRCGVPDLVGSAERVKRYALQGQKWPGTNITWGIKEPMEKTDPYMVRSQLSRAFKVWADASVLTFSEVRGHKADIVVSFLHGSHGDGYPFDGEGSVLAHAFFPGDGIGGDAHFDAEETWLAHNPREEEDGVHLFAVAAHEIGHSLGLSHSSTPGSLMFPYYQVVDGQFKLPEDDANGIQQLYGSRESKQWATMPPAFTRPTNSYTTGSYSTASVFTSRLTTTARKTTRVTRTTTTTTTTTTTKKGTFRFTTPASTTTTTTETPSTTPTRTSTTRSIPRRPTTTVATKPPKRRNGITVPTRQSTVFPRQPSTEKSQIFPTENPVPLPPPPNTCNTSIDAVSVIRREVFLFKNKYFWRLDTNKMLKKGYPVPINRFWYDLPAGIEKVDALYERPIDTKIVFFTGKFYWLFTANELEPGYPRPLTDLGLPSYVDRVDAAMVWGHNGKTYFFSGKQYWKFDEVEGRVELDYPRDVSVWRGVPEYIDSAFQWTDGNTYFFKGLKQWRFNDIKMKARPMASDISKFWFGCQKKDDEVLTTTPMATSSSHKPRDLESSRNSAGGFEPSCTLICVVCTLATVLNTWHMLCRLILTTASRNLLPTSVISVQRFNR